MPWFVCERCQGTGVVEITPTKKRGNHQGGVYRIHRDYGGHRYYYWLATLRLNGTRHVRRAKTQDEAETALRDLRRELGLNAADPARPQERETGTDRRAQWITRENESQ